MHPNGRFAYRSRTSLMMSMTISGGVFGRSPGAIAMPTKRRRGIRQPAAADELDPPYAATLFAGPPNGLTTLSHLIPIVWHKLHWSPAFTVIYDHDHGERKRHIQSNASRMPGGSRPGSVASLA